MRRYPDWPIRLNRYLAKVADRKFRIGRHDCCRFIAGAVEAMTGEDPMAHVPKYSTWEEAKAVMRAESSLYHMLLRRFGKPVHAARAHQGDIAYVNRQEHDIPSLGIVLGRRTLVFGLAGYVQMRTVDIDRAFRVPFEE